ncbi:MAG: pyridoxamine 5'-phosphate oxidase family protein [Armatimonadota bacterium]
MTNQEAIAKAKEIIGRCGFTALATVDNNGSPQIRAMMIMPGAVEDDLTVYYITHRQTAKCSQIAANSKVSSLWTEVVDPMSDWGTVLVKGNASVSDEKTLRDRFWVEEIAQFFPGGVDDPNYVILVIKPTELILTSSENMQPQIVKL